MAAGGTAKTKKWQNINSLYSNYILMVTLVLIRQIYRLTKGVLVSTEHALLFICLSKVSSNVISLFLLSQEK